MQSTISENGNENEGSSRHLGSIRKLILLNNIRIRVVEQMYFLDLKMDSHSFLINELTDFFRQRSQSELNHSYGLEKIFNNFQPNINEPTNKNSKQNNFRSSYTSWQYILAETQYLSQEHAVLSEVYNTNILHKLQGILRIYKKCQELVNETHEEVLRILRNFYTIVNTYHTCQSEYRRAGAKVDLSDLQKRKALNVPRRQTCSQKQTEIYPKEYLENLKARNVYKHYMETFTATIHKHMLRDLRDILYSLDSGFSLMTSKAILAHLTADHTTFYKKLLCPGESVSSQNDKIGETDRQRFLESLKSPMNSSDAKNEIRIQNMLDFEFEIQLQHLKRLEDNLQRNLEKIYRIWDMIDINTLERLRVSENDTKPKPLNVVKQFSLKSYQKAKTESKSKLVRPKLFGGSLEEYIRMTNEQIPLILKSCIRVITLFGLRSQGIFRVSGSQVEILSLRDAFERGDDPLAGATDNSDMNSVAGVLKLYLRELEEPLFPAKYFDLFISLIQMDSNQDIIAGMRSFFKNFSKTVVIVIRYLFSFLYHLSEHASENMMDAFNLAISFGPTLMPAPEDKKQVQYQTQLNDLIKLLIIYNKHIFPKDLEGPQYNETVSETNDINNRIQEWTKEAFDSGEGSSQK